MSYSLFAVLNQISLLQVMGFSAESVASFIAVVGVLSVLAQVRIREKTTE